MISRFLLYNFPAQYLTVGFVFLQALAAPGSSRSRTATGTTTASPAPRASRRWWAAASSPTAMILFAPSAPSKSLCKPEKQVPQSPLLPYTEKKYISSSANAFFQPDAHFNLRHTLLNAFYFLFHYFS